MPRYSNIVFLNLYSRVDTKKIVTTDLIRSSCEKKLGKIIQNESDFLIIYGKLKKQRGYNFINKAKELFVLLQNKNNYKINIGTMYPPHLENFKIFYRSILYFQTVFPTFVSLISYVLGIL